MPSTPIRARSFAIRTMLPLCLLATSFGGACGEATDPSAQETSEETALAGYDQQRVTGGDSRCGDDDEPSDGNDGSDDDEGTDDTGGAEVDANTGIDGDDAGIDPGPAEEEPTADDSGATLGEAGVVDATIVVHAGEVFDGQGKRFTAGAALGDGSQSETQKPVFKLEAGATLINVVLGAPAADGIHTHGDVNLKNIVWEDIGEDALTIKESGTVVLDGGSAANGEDKVFQINAPSTFRVSNFTAVTAGKFIRQNGGTKFKVDVVIDRCDISQMKEAIFRTDSSVSTVSMTNTRFSKIGKTLFLGVNPSNVSTSNNAEY